MPKMSSEYATFHETHDLIYSLQNPALASPLIKLGNGHNEAFSTLYELFRKASSPSVPLKVPVREIVQEKLKEANQEISRMKSASQSKPVIDKEPLRLTIVEA